MSRLVKLIAALGLAASAIVGFQVSPAAAHSDNNYAAWACGATRRDADHVLMHAHAVWLTSEYVLAYCESRTFGQSPADVYCRWNAYLFADGTVFGPVPNPATCWYI
jgi:hypothetical protein